MKIGEKEWDFNYGDRIRLTSPNYQYKGVLKDVNGVAYVVGQEEGKHWHGYELSPKTINTWESVEKC